MMSNKIKNAIKTIQLFAYEIDCPDVFLKAIEILINYVEEGEVKI